MKCIGWRLCFLFCFVIPFCFTRKHNFYSNKFLPPPSHCLMVLFIVSLLLLLLFFLHYFWLEKIFTTNLRETWIHFLSQNGFCRICLLIIWFWSSCHAFTNIQLHSRYWLFFLFYFLCHYFFCFIRVFHLQFDFLYRKC